MGDFGRSGLVRRVGQDVGNDVPRLLVAWLLVIIRIVAFNSTLRAGAVGRRRGRDVSTVSLVTIALDRSLDLRKQPPAGSTPIGGLAGVVRTEGTPTIYLFAFGAAVVEADALDEPLEARLVALTGAGLLPETEETWVVQAGAEASVGWDRVSLPGVEPMRVATVALLLAQSAALERYDNRANALLDEVLVLLAGLEARGRMPLLMGGIVSRVAAITAAQLQLSRSFFLVDRPELTWEDAVSSRVFDALYEHLELEERHAAVLQKLDNLSTALRTVADLRHGRQGLLLELAIVLLIVIEVVMMVIAET